jgi:C4-dicarboxylate-specific signal transduction histidine kinase
LRSSMAAVGQVAGSVAREIGGPLTAIEMAVDRLRRLHGMNGEEGNVELRTILEQSHRLAALARTLLALARPVRPRMRPVDLATLAREVAAAVERELRGHGIELVLEGPEGPMPAVGDPHQIREVLVALLTNARMALEEWPEKRWIRLRWGHRRDGAPCIQVVDSGPGIPAGEEERIFLPFVSGWGREGIGLSLSQLALMEQGGELMVHEGAGESGAAFSLVFCADPGSGPQGPAPDDGSTRSGPGSEAAYPASRPGSVEAASPSHEEEES